MVGLTFKLNPDAVKKSMLGRSMFGYDTIRVIERSILRQTVYKGAGGVDDDDEPRPTYATSYAYLLHCVVTTAVKEQEYCQIPEDELHEEIMEDMYYLLSA